VRAVTQPYPGAFTHSGDRKVIVWKATACSREGTAVAGTVLALDPLTIACGEGALTIDSGQPENGLCVAGAQLARAGVVPGQRPGRSRSGDRHSGARRAYSSSA
jgi:UDP-4-amino-4-deoxy-L-arabinose formyltransferase/UDP-glucuronic acid dehydrogenase (UDP-4-keto-hexauronic acid decarboxylating)